MAITVMEALSRTVQKYPTKPAMRYKSEGVWQSLTWQDYGQTVRRVARGLCALGLQDRAFVGILSYNCKEWVFADIGSIFSGAVPAGIYPTSSPDQCVYILKHCGASCVFVEDAKQLAKVLAVRSQISTLQFIILMKGKSAEKDVYTWNEILLRGSEFSEAELDKRIQKQSPKNLATLVYTSGTTAHPKAVMLSHDNLTWMSQTSVQFDLKLTSEDSLLSYLPLSHIAEQITTVHGPIFLGACIAFAENMETVPANLREIRPTLFLGVPRVWEKIHSKILEREAQIGPVKRRIAKWAKGVGMRYGEDFNKHSTLSYRLAHKLVFAKVREALGFDRCRFAATAAAPIARETLEFFMGFGIPLYEIYGMSECTGPTTVSNPEYTKLGKTGACIKGGELKIAEDGEILIRGRHVFMGYLHDEKATKEVLDAEGWLHSGDIGNLDEDGFLAITGRKKNLIITAGGENVAPEMLENKLKCIPEVEQAVVVGDRRKFLTALITLSPEALHLVKKKEIASPAKNQAELLTCEKFHNYLQEQITAINGTVARVQTIKNFKILPQNFSEESGELTPTLKVKRGVVLTKFASEIEAMY